MLHIAKDVLALAMHILPLTRYPYHGHVVDCPVCESEDALAIASFDRRLKKLPTAMCKHCGLLYTNPMPTDAELADYYSRHYRFDYQFAASKPSRRHSAKRNREAADRLANVAGLLPVGARTLDFGAGSGEFVAQMLAAGFDSRGFEPGETYAQHARTSLGDRIRIADWQSVRYESEFDLVTSFHVLEHLCSPVRAIKAMASWIAPGGKVYIEVPDMAFKAKNKGFASLHFAHVVGFNHFNLRLAARAGLRLFDTVGPTGLVFERGKDHDLLGLAQEGLALARRNCVDVSPAAAYVNYHLRKVGIGRSILPAAFVESLSEAGGTALLVLA